MNVPNYCSDIHPQLKAQPTAMYIHIPFCLQRCAYCDFNTYAGILHLRPAYTEAVNSELRQIAQQHPDSTLSSIYFGGGTPSLLAPTHILDILTNIRQHFRLTQDVEITMEANPGTLDASMLAALHHAGVHRLSIGVQSTHPDELRMLGRIHTWEGAQNSLAMARATGFENISLDLMYGLPKQNMTRWRQTLERTLDLGPQHLSLYALTVEPGTPLASAIAAVQYPTPDPDLAADMYEWASERLLAAGFWQYEISNWALGLTPAPEIWALPPRGVTEAISPWICRHNLVYWRNQPWLAAGAGAHAWFEGRRRSNLHHPNDYIAAIHSGETSQDVEIISPPLVQGETMMMGLRLAEGVTEQHFQEQTGRTLASVYSPILRQLHTSGLLEWDEKRARLSAAGRLLGNQVFAAFLP